MKSSIEKIVKTLATSYIIEDKDTFLNSHGKSIDLIDNDFDWVIYLYGDYGQTERVIHRKIIDRLYSAGYTVVLHSPALSYIFVKE